MKNQILKLSFAILLIFTITLTLVSADHVVCLTKGQAVPSLSNARYTCKHQSCQVCVDDNNFPVYNKDCPGSGSCTGSNNNGSIDSKPPVLTVTSPVQNANYATRGVVFSLTTDESSTIYILDNINGHGSWQKLAQGVKSFSKSLSMKDGPNDVSIKAVDSMGNPTIQEIKFNVDSQKPKFTSTLPAKGFANGVFSATFSTGVPQSLVLTYGNDALGRKTANLDLSKCTTASGKFTCSVTVDLSSYNNQNIDYKFTLTNIAGTSVSSKIVSLKVDNSAPIFTNIGSMYTISGKNVMFNIGVNEANLLLVSYVDNSATYPKSVKLCTSLSSGYCKKKVAFSKGSHQLTITASDQAGSSTNTDIQFTIA